MGDALSSTDNSRYDDEIDLIELAINLWQEKATIAVCIAIATIVGIAIGINHDNSIQPIYKTEVQLTIPSSSQLKEFNQTDYYKISQHEAFKEFINILESNSHKHRLFDNKAVIQEILGKPVNKDNLRPILESREIEYPDTSVEISSITPEKYLASYQGNNKNHVINASLLDLILAQKAALESIQLQYDTALELKIEQLKRADILQRKILNDHLNAEIRYLKDIQIDSPQDDKVATLKKEILLLEKNHLVEQLKTILNTEMTNDIKFYDKQIQAKAEFAKSKKWLSTIVGILLGTMLGFFIATARIIYKNNNIYSQKKTHRRI